MWPNFFRTVSLMNKGLLALMKSAGLEFFNSWDKSYGIVTIRAITYL